MDVDPFLNPIFCSFTSWNKSVPIYFNGQMVHPFGVHLTLKFWYVLCATLSAFIRVGVLKWHGQSLMFQQQALVADKATAFSIDCC